MLAATVVPSVWFQTCVTSLSTKIGTFKFLLAFELAVHTSPIAVKKARASLGQAPVSVTLLGT